MSYDLGMDTYQDGPRVSTIISLLAALSIFGGLYIVIPRYLEKTPIIETTNLIDELQDEVNPIPTQAHDQQALSTTQASSRFDTLFTTVERSMQLEQCRAFTQVDYLRAWLSMCSKKSMVSEVCATELTAIENTTPVDMQRLNRAMSTTCACTLTQAEGRAIEDMLKRAQSICLQKYK
jgi:hypothetical protein